MNQKEQDEFCKKHGLKKYHVLMQVEYGGHPISEKGFAIDLRGELEVCVFARSEKEAEGIAYNSYKSACRDVSYVELDCEWDDDEEDITTTACFTEEQLEALEGAKVERINPS